MGTRSITSVVGAGVGILALSGLLVAVPAATPPLAGDTCDRKGDPLQCWRQA